MDCFEKTVKTCCGFHGQKGRIRMVKIFFFFSLNYKSFPIQSGFEQLSSSIRWRVLSI